MAIRRVAIVGDGPAGTALAALLARRGARVVLFARGRPSGLVVGESMVPAVVPILRELGIEEAVRGIATFKPGATFVVDGAADIEIDFAEVCGRAPGYAYNVPRDRFDAVLLQACAASGARVLECAARFQRADGDGVGLDPASREAAREALGGEPDFAVDASGRARSLARLLGLPTRAGARRDAALFAHCQGVPIHNAGHVHSDRLDFGWCWRIPLPGRVSLGVVVPPELLRGLGSGAEAQYDALLARDPWLRKLTRDSRRVSRVARYTNYQLTTLRGVGANWALVGDSFGFIDPVFSSGLYLALWSARELAGALAAGSARTLRRYERRCLAHLASWQRAAELFYEGTFFALFQMSRNAEKRAFGRAVNPHLTRHIGRVFTGEGSAGRYDPWVLRLTSRAAAREPGREELRIRG